jgi:uncharacterized protein (TIGR04141 family)
MKFSIKLGKPNRNIAALLKNGHNLQGPLANWDGIQGSELYYGQAYESEPQWKDYIETGAGQVLPALVNQGAAAVLFIPAGNRFLIYVFGYGFLSVNDGFTEWDFGLKVVLNSISPTGIKSLDSHTVSQKAKNKRIQVATQAGIAEFDVDILQDLVSQISGKSIDPTFASNLTGGETLTMVADMAGTSIARKSVEIMRRYALTSYQANFNWIDFIAPVKDPTILDTLNQAVKDALDGLITGAGHHEFVLSYPKIIDMENLDYITFGGISSDTEFETIDISDFIVEYQASGLGTPIGDLERFFINLHDGHEKVLKSFPLSKCLTTEIDDNGSFYILASGTWFKLNDDHYDTVTNFFNALIASPQEYVSGEQTAEVNERGYLAQPMPAGSELFDQRNHHLRGVTNAIEIADIVTDQAEIIHVKDGGSSAKLSHLFNQGTVSGTLLLTDKKFRTDFRSKIADPNIKKLFPAAAINPGNTTIVFKILKKGPNFRLPFFTKIILYDTYQKVKKMGYKFRLEWVEYV